VDNRGSYIRHRPGKDLKASKRSHSNMHTTTSNKHMISKSKGVGEQISLKFWVEFLAHLIGYRGANLGGQQRFINKPKVGKGLNTNKMPHSNMLTTTSNKHMINKGKGRRVHNKISTPRRLRRWTTHEIPKKGMEGGVVLALLSFLHSKDLRVFLIYHNCMPFNVPCTTL